VTGLQIKALKVARGGKQGLYNVDLTFALGKITALLGANGAGKSSLVLAIAGVLPVSGGQVLLEDASLVGLRPETVRAASPLCLKGIRCWRT